MAEGARLLSEYRAKLPSRVRIPPSPLIARPRADSDANGAAAAGGVPNWWLAQAAPAEPLEILAGAREADVCIVGGGFTGLWTALRDQGDGAEMDVVVLEAELWIRGQRSQRRLRTRPSGTTSSRWSGSAAASRGGRLARASADAVAEIGSFCEEHGIDAQYAADGWMWTATNRSQLGAWDSTLAAIEAAASIRSSGSTRRGCRCAADLMHIAGVFERVSASVSPALLARGMLRVAREQGVQRVSSARRWWRSTAPHRWRCGPAGGQVSADRVVITMGSWAAQMRELRTRSCRRERVVLSEVVPRGACAGRAGRRAWRSPTHG